MTIDGLKSSIRRLLSYPYEDGASHPVEAPLREFWLEDSQALIDWIVEMLTTETYNATDLETILWCFGHFAFSSKVMSTALKHPDLRVRNAAVTAFEGYPGAKAVLLKHEEPDEWLRNYIQVLLRGDW